MAWRHRGAATFKFFLSGTRVPVVTTYKYCGLQLSSDGRWEEHCKSIGEKTRKRTWELIRWARSCEVSLDVVERLWMIHVSLSVTWGMAIMRPPPRLHEQLDVTQRRAGRLLLGHSRTSPIPTVCLELGWLPWSFCALKARLHLLSRILFSKHSLIRAVVHMSATEEDSWLCTVSDEARVMAPQGLPVLQRAWRTLLREWDENARCEALTSLLEQCNNHPCLANYQPAPCIFEGAIDINRIIHDKSLDADRSRAVARLLAGGQGLRGGDPHLADRITPRTACLHCLRQGLRRREGLIHVTFECPAYVDIREQANVAEAWRSAPKEVLCFSRDLWSWRQLRANREALLQILDWRREILQQWGGLRLRRQQDRALTLWPTAS